MLRVKREAGLNRKLTISFGSAIGLTMAVCFFIGIPDFPALVTTIFSSEFLLLTLKTSFVLLPIHGLYVVLFSSSKAWFKATRVLGATILIVLLSAADFYFGHAIVSWWLKGASIQQVLLSFALVLFLGIFEVRIGSRWYSFFYNQRNEKVGMGWLTIVSDGGSVTSILGINSFTGKLP